MSCKRILGKLLREDTLADLCRLYVSTSGRVVGVGGGGSAGIYNVTIFMFLSSDAIPISI